MGRPGSFHEATTEGRPRYRRRAGALLLGVSSALVVGSFPVPAGAQAQEPTVFVNCEGSSSLGARVTGFPPDDFFNFFAMTKRDDGSSTVYQGQSIFTDETGSGSTLRVPGSLPTTIGFAVYRDTNANSRWDPDADDTLYRGSGR